MFTDSGYRTVESPFTMRLPSTIRSLFTLPPLNSISSSAAFTVLRTPSSNLVIFTNATSAPFRVSFFRAGWWLEAFA